MNGEIRFRSLASLPLPGQPVAIATPSGAQVVGRVVATSPTTIRVELVSQRDQWGRGVRLDVEPQAITTISED